MNGAAADRERVVAHLAVCDECTARFGALMDSRPVDTPPQTPVDAAVYLGRRVRTTTRQLQAGWLRGRSWQVAAAGALAALIAVVVLVPALRDTRDETDDFAIRSTGLLLIEPIGTVTTASELRWTSPVETTRFRVELYDSQERELLATVVTGQRLALPDDLRRQLQAGVEYRWRVTALDAAGQPTLQSDLRTFVVSDR
jgi:hypothetical protein